MSEQDNENDSEERPSWFTEWLRSIGMEEMPEWRSEFYPEWYRRAYPVAKAYGERLWWESAFVPYAFAPSYAWSALSRVENLPYYRSRSEYQGGGPSFQLRAGRPDERTLYRPSYYLGEASAAYYRTQIETTPAFLIYQASKLGSYGLGAAGIGGLGLWRGFAFAPTGFAFDVATGAAQAPYIREMVQRFGPEYTAAAIQQRATLYPFQAPTPAEVSQSVLEWTFGQSSLLFLRPAVSSAVSAIRTTGDLWAGLPALGEGIGGLAGLAQGFGFGLLQLSAQLTAQELSYIYNMGEAGLGGQIYAGPQARMEAAERWALITGSLLAGAWLSFGVAGIGAASLAFAGAAALGLQLTSDIRTRQQFNIPWNEPLTYTRSKAFGGEFQINPRLVGEKIPGYTPPGRVNYQDIVGPLAWTPQYERRYESTMQAFTDVTGWRWGEYPRGWAPQYERASSTFSWSEVFRRRSGIEYYGRGEGFGQPLIAGTPAAGLSYADYTRAEDRFGLQEQMIRGVTQQYAPALTAREKYELSGLAGMPSFEGMSYQGYHYEVGRGYVTEGQFPSMSSFLEYAKETPGANYYYDAFRGTWYTVKDAGAVTASPAYDWYANPDLSKYDLGTRVWGMEKAGLTGNEQRAALAEIYGVSLETAEFYQTQRGGTTGMGGGGGAYWKIMASRGFFRATSLAQYTAPEPVPDIWAYLGREAYIEKGWKWKYTDPETGTTYEGGSWAQGYQESRGDEAYRMRQTIYDVIYDLVNTGIIQKGSGGWTLQDSLQVAEAISPGLSLKMYDDSNR